MTHRERVLAALRFQRTDRLPYDLMEGTVWPELQEYFREKYGLQDANQVLTFLDTDFRWTRMTYQGPEEFADRFKGVREREDAFTKYVGTGRLSDAQSVSDIESAEWPDPNWWQVGDIRAFRDQWPDHALVFWPGWKPLFWSACEAFGMEEALVKMLTSPLVFEAFVRRQHDFYMSMLERGLEAAKGLCDVCWLGDDYASNKAMLMSPPLWRRHIKPFLAKQVALARDYGMHVFMHSCGAVRPILPDLIEIGVTALLVFQTTAEGMDAESIAAEFGGSLAFYGGIDVQQLLSYGTTEEVEARVRANAEAFARYGGYVVANSHHGVATIRGENIVAMCRAARGCKLGLHR